MEIEKIKIHRDKDHTNDIKLNEELGLMMKYPNLKLQQKIAQIAEEQHEIEGLFDTMISCIDYIYDKETTYPSKDHTEKEMKDLLYKRPIKFLIYLIKFITSLTELILFSISYDL